MMDLVVAPNGTVTAIYAETIDFRILGPTTITRASQVEPDADGQWFAHIIDGPVLGPFARRSDALAAEVDWLTQNRLLHPDDGSHEKVIST
ncbi:hypothetical protein [Schlesneria sp. T3-172]|uniref:hypothetical protein n=1 Tax=Schlesneria sphaerica TaxID=3373610 RepID=UPI0037CBDE2D